MHQVNLQSLIQPTHPPMYSLHRGGTRNKLHSRHSADGLRIVAMPSRQFNQEAKTDEGIAKNVKELGVEYSVLQPGDVNGEKESPLYTWLKENTTSDDVTWNFGTYCESHRAAAFWRLVSCEWPRGPLEPLSRQCTHTMVLLVFRVTSLGRSLRQQGHPSRQCLPDQSRGGHCQAPGRASAVR